VFARADIASTTGANRDLATPDVARTWFAADVGGGPSNAPDGLADLIIVNDTAQHVVTLLGNGDGSWRKVEAAYAVSLHASLHGHVVSGRGDRHNWRMMDVNGDGRADLVHTSLVQAGPLIGGSQSPGTVLVETLIARGDGNWDAPPGSHQFIDTYTDTDVRGFMITDVDGDGRADLLKVQNVQDRPTTGSQTPVNAVVWTLLSRGANTWEERTQPITENIPATARWFPMEVNGDGRVDLASLLTRPGEPLLFSVMMSLGNGRFNPRPRPHSTRRPRARCESLIWMVTGARISSTSSEPTLTPWPRSRR
jgi:hypothetical protein